MKKKQLSVIESEVQLHISRIVEKYTNIGFKVYSNYRRKGKVIDLYAYNPKTKERVIFEIKHISHIKPIDRSSLIEQIQIYKSLFPDARVILSIVRAQDTEFPKLKLGIEDMLLDCLQNNYLNEFANKILEFNRLNKVSGVNITYVNFNDFNSISLKGSANIDFWNNFNDERFVGEMLSDGLPFKFELLLKFDSIYSKTENKAKYNIDINSSNLSFDFSEFA